MRKIPTFVIWTAKISPDPLVHEPAPENLAVGIIWGNKDFSVFFNSRSPEESENT